MVIKENSGARNEILTVVSFCHQAPALKTLFKYLIISSPSINWRIISVRSIKSYTSLLE